MILNLEMSPAVQPRVGALPGLRASKNIQKESLNAEQHRIFFCISVSVFLKYRSWKLSTSPRVLQPSLVSIFVVAKREMFDVG